MPRLVAAFVVSLCAGLCAGCFDDSSSIISVPTRSLLTVDPAVFLGDVQCGAPELRRYVVTLSDVSVEPRAQFVSAPTLCTNKVSYAAPPLVRDDLYTARIDGYDRDDLVPLADGSATMIDPATSEVVPPRWTTTCGGPIAAEDGGRADAQSFGSANPVLSPTQFFGVSEVFLSGCLPLQLVSAPGTAGLPDASSPTPGEVDGGPDEAGDGG